ncbi:MAG: flagellar motor switch phosphatase FliY [Clostridiales bacterium]|nr:flagellar motor switch phosphatase FliY [Clostridiales bacterium]
MDGMLSQDEINALLNGMDLSESDNSGDSATSGVEAAPIDESLLLDVEKDAIGEIANISMGSSATTLYSLVNRKVNITTPRVTLSNWASMTEDYERPCVFIQIRYTSGLEGSNILVLKEHDVKIITDLMMGGDGTNTDGELGEMHLSAISEAMNQMMGSAATSLSTMLGTMIDISPPDASLIDLNAFKTGSDIASFLDGTFVKISFRMQIGDLVDSTIMQLYPIDFAKTLYETFINNQIGNPEPEQAPDPIPEPPRVQNIQQQMGIGGNEMQQQMAMRGMPQMGMPQMQSMNVQPAQFQNFSADYSGLQSNENIGLIMDVPLEVTVELGRTSKSISEILDFAPGTIIELDKIAGEPIDVLVNGKFVAKGEVVVIEESFGIRVTEIIK